MLVISRHCAPDALSSTITLNIDLDSFASCRAAALSRKTVLAAWMTDVIALCTEKEPLLLFFHGCSVTDGSQQTDDTLRDKDADALRDLVLVSHVTIRVAPAPTVSETVSMFSVGRACVCKTHNMATKCLSGCFLER